MVDIDKNELHKINVRPQLAIEADAKEFMLLLLKHKDKIQKKDYSSWMKYAKDMKSRYPIVTEEAKQQKQLVNTYALLDAITDQMAEDDIYVSGSSGTCIDVSMQTFRVKKGQRVFCTKGLASMGFGVPATIGACQRRWWFSDEYSGTGNNTPLESSNQDLCAEQSGICADPRNTEKYFSGTLCSL